MKRTGFFYNDVFLEHDAGAGHPERPERLQAILGALERAPFSGSIIRFSEFPARAPQSLFPIHDKSYVEWVGRRIGEGARVLDYGDTGVCPRSWEAALRSADAAVDAADRVWNGELDRAFVAPRPPGHHAEAGRAMGFCIFNNIAVAAAWLLDHDAQRVAIVDWDVHHGNGTQAAFYSNPRLLFISLHQYPHYPGSGGAAEKGAGDGLGTTLNIPMRPGSGDEHYLAAFEDMVIPALDDFEPEMILVSAGFDSHSRDPLSSIMLSTEFFGEMTQQLCAAANRHCKGRLVSVLEGGYDLTALSEASALHVETMLNE
ncbi:MAG TPA: histone deacetylase [Acidobacteriota bacterium]|nr:histone deacetylase [Acidobacteriota bacterium]